MIFPIRQQKQHLYIIVISDLMMGSSLKYSIIVLKKMKNPRTYLLRDKSQLRNELLSGIKNIRHPQTAPQRQKQPLLYSPIINGFDLSIASKHKVINNTIKSEMHQLSCHRVQNDNFSILDEFSKCPVREDESFQQHPNFLNKFYRNVQKKTDFQKVEKNSSWKETVQNHQPKVKGNPMTQEQRAKNENMVEFSLIDVSGNLTNLKYEDSYENDFIVNMGVNANDVSGNGLGINNEQKNAQIYDKPNTKIINLKKSRPYKESGNKKKYSEQSKNSLKEQTDFQNSQSENNNQQRNNNDEQLDEQHKLNKLLQRKSLIKQMIITQQEDSSEGQSDKQQPKQCLENLDSSQILTMLPNYESSSSMLDPVIEDELEDLEDSIAKKPISEEPKNIFEGIQKQKVQKNGPLQQISISELSLQDLADISEIHKISSGKMFSDQKQIKKISEEISGSNLNQLFDDVPNNKIQQVSKSSYSNNSELSNFIRSKPAQNIEKMMVNDINTDIKSLKNKIQSQIELERGPRRAHKQSSGSSGPSNKSESMMEFFDAFNKKLNMQEIQKDISGLRNRILNDGSFE